MNRTIVRSFLESVNWATPRNIDLLINGKVTNSQALRVELGDMVTDIRNPQIRLKRLHNLVGSSVYALHRYPKGNIGSGNKFFHDCKLRDCLAKFLSNQTNLIEKLNIDPPADATIISPRLYFEMDNGHMSVGQLREKLIKNYSVGGAYQVIFFMADRDGKAHLEQGRLDLLFEIVKNTLPTKRGRVLGACYSQFLIDGKLYNWRRVVC